MIYNSYIDIRNNKKNELLKYIEYAEGNLVNEDEYMKAKFELENFERILEARKLTANVEIFATIIDVNENEAYFNLNEIGIIKFIFENEIDDNLLNEFKSFINENSMFNLFDMDIFYDIGDWEYWTEELLNLHFKYGNKEKNND